MTHALANARFIAAIAIGDGVMNRQKELTMTIAPRISFVREQSDGSFRAYWRGQQSTATFNSRGAGQAWIATCERTERFRA